MSCSGYRQCLWQTLWITQHVESCSVVPIQAETNTQHPPFLTHIQTIWLIPSKIISALDVLSIKKRQVPRFEKQIHNLQPANTKLAHTHTLCAQDYQTAPSLGGWDVRGGRVWDRIWKSLMRLQGAQEECPNQTHRPRTQMADPEQDAVKPKARTHTHT